MKRKLEKYRRLFSRELYQNVLPFWMKYSPDRKYGGYFTCLDRDGKLYDDKKYVWLQGRQVWTFSKLYNTAGQKEEWLEMAKLGADFIRRHARTPDGRYCFSLTRDGRPYFIQRKIFSECFCALGLGEYAKATKDSALYAEAVGMFREAVEMSKDPSKLGRPVLSGPEDASSLANPMILLSLADELETEENKNDFAQIKKSCIEEIKLHVRPELKLVLETVRTDGTLIDSPEGRLVNPGHAIESGWFLLHHAMKTNDLDLLKLGQNIIDWSFNFGWDRKYGGLYYFLDSKGFSPLQLEWQMKLFWQNAEAIYSFLLLYHLTLDPGYFRKFEKVTDFAFKNFSDPKYGEWFANLDRRLVRTHNFKGSAYKGCFHIPRFLLFSLQLMEKMMDR
jgi:N-acylglucosamine 2-epimerase